MAEALLQARLIADYPDLAAHILVHSAGTSAIEGNPATSTAVQAMDLWGIDLDPHRATELTPAMLLKADAVLTMAREHLLNIGRLEPQALQWSTTFKHLAAMSALVGERLGTEPVRGEHEARSRIRKVFDVLRGADRADGFMVDIQAPGSDIIDPIGGSLRVYLGVAEDIESSLAAVLTAFFGRPEAGRE